MAKKVSTKKAEETVETPVILRPDVDVAVEKRLIALYTLQSVDSEIDKIKIIRGELPQAVQDLEDEIAGLNTRIENFTAEIKETEAANKQRNVEISEHQEQIKKYQKQQDNVRNNREYESLNKEIEFQDLEIQLCERKMKEGTAHIKELKQHIEAAKLLRQNREKDLDAKREELLSITAETEKDEQRLLAKSKEQEQYFEGTDERYLVGYKRIRNAARNGLAVVTIDRDSCGGCFSVIPPQRQMEIKMHKKVIVCENCGRILVDDDIAAKAKAQLEK
jgi:predicted  nucleic acid-binding Zn-ribbon protein